MDGLSIFFFTGVWDAQGLVVLQNSVIFNARPTPVSNRKIYIIVI